MNNNSYQTTQLYEDALYYHLIHEGLTPKQARIQINKLYLQKERI